MIMYLVALVIITFSIFGFTYSQMSIQTVRDSGERLSTIIQLPTFLHRTPLIENPQAEAEGDNGMTTISSQQSLEISSHSMEEVNTGADQSQEDRYQLERRIFEQKLRDANQIGLADSLWPREMQNDSDKVIEELLNHNKHSPDTSKPASRKLNTNAIFNMIQYETFKEAMAVIKNQQEQEQAARALKTNEDPEKSATNDGRSLLDDEQKENLPANDKNIH